MNARQRFDVLARDSFKCRYCGRAAPEVVLHVDHVIPLALGGADSEANLVTACFDCNEGKRDGLIIGARVERRRSRSRGKKYPVCVCGHASNQHGAYRCVANHRSDDVCREFRPRKASQDDGKK